MPDALSDTAGTCIAYLLCALCGQRPGELGPPVNICFKMVYTQAIGRFI